MHKKKLYGNTAFVKNLLGSVTPKENELVHPDGLWKRGKYL